MCFNISITNSTDDIKQQLNVEFHRNFSFKPKKHIVHCDNDLEDHRAPDIFSFSDDEINQIQLRDLRSY